MARRVRGSAARLPIHLISALMQEFTDRLVAIVDEAVRAQVADTIDAYRASIYEGAASRHSARNGRASPLKGSRCVCRVPGCGSSASPRYDLFCKEHRLLPESEKSTIILNAKLNQGRQADAPPLGETSANAEPGSQGDDSNEPLGANVVRAQEAGLPPDMEEQSTEPGDEGTLPSKPTCSVPECSGGWFRPSGGRKLCRNHWQGSRAADDAPAAPDDANGQADSAAAP